MAESELESSIQSDPLSNTGQQIKLKLTIKSEMKVKKDNMCRLNIYGNCIDEGRIAGLSYILAIGNKEPHSREEALRCLVNVCK